MSDQGFVVENREQLVYLLSEAAEIEHGLMCCYLYAAFSLKRADPAWSQAEAALVTRWRGELLSVARDEMMHLATACNLLNAIGGAPHLARQNFPVSPGYHPSGVVLRLAPFELDTMQHFVFMERPHGAADPDGKPFEAALVFERGARRGALVPSAQDYTTVGDLYRGIEQGFVELEGRLGAQALFDGDPRLQVSFADFALTGLAPVRDLASAKAAIECVLEQGEGVSTPGERCHYKRFTQVRDELVAALAANPAFTPAWPAATNPVMRKPPNPEVRVHVVLEPAASLLDLANGVYTLMLRALEACMSPLAFNPTVRKATLALAQETMRAMSPLAARLAELPANPAHAGTHAGVTFTMSRSLRNVPDGAAALRGLAEWCEGIAREAQRQQASAPEELAPLLAMATRHGQRLQQLANEALAAANAPAAPVAPVAPPKPAPAPAIDASRSDGSGIEVARGKVLDIVYTGKLCIHSRHCVLDAPQVFLANTPGEWIFPDRADVDDLVHVAHNCPSGAIRYRRHDGGAEEAAPRVNTIRVRENGPLAVNAALALDGAVGFRATLCRCGQSKNKPFCDGSHVAAGFAASGEPKTVSADPLPQRDGSLAIRPQKNGPLAVEGNLELCAGTGRTVLRTTQTRLCRCGQSANKPFCDGSHARVGFVAAGE